MKKTIWLSSRDMAQISLCAALMAVSARISFPLPIYPVSFSLQTFVVALCSLLLAPRSACLTMILYIFIGLIGVPVFSGGGGLSYILQPSFGYLLGFIIAAPCISRVSHCKYPFAKTLGCLTGTFIIEALGTVYFALISTFYLSQPLTIGRVIYVFLIYLPLDIIKNTVAITLTRLVEKRFPHISSHV